MLREGFSYHIETAPSNAKCSHDNDSVPSLGSKKFGMREKIVAFPVYTRSLVPMNESPYS